MAPLGNRPVSEQEKPGWKQTEQIPAGFATFRPNRKLTVRKSTGNPGNRSILIGNVRLSPGKTIIEKKNRPPIEKENRPRIPDPTKIRDIAGTNVPKMKNRGLPSGTAARTQEEEKIVWRIASGGRIYNDRAVEEERRNFLVDQDFDRFRTIFVVC